MMHLIIFTTIIVVILATEIMSINSNFENAFAQEGDSEIPPLVEPDKNITIMAMDEYQSELDHFEINN